MPMHTRRPRKAATHLEPGARAAHGRESRSGWILFGHYYECVEGSEGGTPRDRSAALSTQQRVDPAPAEPAGGRKSRGNRRTARHVRAASALNDWTHTLYRAFALCLLILCSWDVLADSPGPVRNPDRTYPTSCLAAPLPQTPSGPTVTAFGTLPTLNDVQEYPGYETVKFVFWRTPCVGGTSALLLQASRIGDTSVNSVEWFGGFGMAVAQNGTSAFARLALEPNTRYSSVKFDTVFASSLTMVLENVSADDPTQLAAATSFDFDKALTVTIPNVVAIGIDPTPPPITAAIPAYDATQYPNAGLPLQISGYQTGNYADPSAAAQGVQVEVAEAPSAQRTLILAWYTYDATGTPYWLFNSASFAPGARSVSLPLSYFSGGAFVTGNGSPVLWGNVSVSFPDCDHLQLTYQSAPGLPGGTPQGSGTRTFSRLTSINGLACD
jgi:hypothetical protein